MLEYTSQRTISEDTTSLDMNEFVDILKYELAIPQSRNSIADTIRYLEKRGFVIYRSHNI